MGGCGGHDNALLSFLAAGRLRNWEPERLRFWITVPVPTGCFQSMTEQRWGTDMGPFLQDANSFHDQFFSPSHHPLHLFKNHYWGMIDLLKSYIGKKKSYIGTSLEVQRLRLHLPMQGCVGSIPGQGIKIPHASWPKNQSIKQEQYCNIVNKDFKNGPHKKKSLKKFKTK